MNLKKFGKVFTSKLVGTGPLSYGKRIYRAAVSQRLKNTGIVGWVGLRTGLDECRKFYPQPVFDPRTVQPRANDKVFILFIYSFICSFYVFLFSHKPLPS